MPKPILKVSGGTSKTHSNAFQSPVPINQKKIVTIRKIIIEISYL